MTGFLKYGSGFWLKEDDPAEGTPAGLYYRFCKTIYTAMILVDYT